MKLIAATNLFLNEYENPGTRRAYADVLRLLCDHLGEAVDVTTLKPVDMTVYAQMLNKRPFAPATLRKHIKSIKTFFNWLVRIEVLPNSPARVIRQKRLPTYITRDKAMADEELDKVLEYVRWKPRDYALVLFLADTGCRAGGAAGLRVKDLNFSRQEAVVTEKGNKTRTVVYGKRCRTAIKQWLAHRAEKGHLGEYVFSHDGTRLLPDNLSQIVRRACLRVGVRSLGSHSLRHRKGHQLADARIAPSIAATALGHSDPNVTLQHYYPADTKSAQRALFELTLDDDPATKKPDNLVTTGFQVRKFKK